MRDTEPVDEEGPGSVETLADGRFMGAVVLLAVNDRVLKEAWPSWWTGKLSDVAGMVVFPVVLAALFARPAPSFGLGPARVRQISLLLSGGARRRPSRLCGHQRGAAPLLHPDR